MPLIVLANLDKPLGGSYEAAQDMARAITGALDGPVDLFWFLACCWVWLAEGHKGFDRALFRGHFYSYLPPAGPRT